jgi:hypothetical protein
LEDRFWIYCEGLHVSQGEHENHCSKNIQGGTGEACRECETHVPVVLGGAEDMRSFAEQLRPVVQLEKVDYKKLQYIP